MGNRRHGKLVAAATSATGDISGQWRHRRGGGDGSGVAARAWQSGVRRQHAQQIANVLPLKKRIRHQQRQRASRAAWYKRASKTSCGRSSKTSGWWEMTNDGNDRRENIDQTRVLLRVRGVRATALAWRVFSGCAARSIAAKQNVAATARGNAHRWCVKNAADG